MTPVGRPKAFDETAALEAAMEVFWAKGYEGASMADLVEAMGIGRQSLYDTFGGKRALYLRALRLYAEEAAQPLLEALRGEAEPVERLRTLLEHWERIQTCPDCKGCLLSNALAQFDRGDPDVAALAGEHQRRLTRALEDVVAEGQRKGQIASAAAPGDLAALLASIAHGLSIAGRGPEHTAVVPGAVRALRALIGA